MKGGKVPEEKGAELEAAEMTMSTANIPSKPTTEDRNPPKISNQSKKKILGLVKMEEEGGGGRARRT